MVQHYQPTITVRFEDLDRATSRVISYSIDSAYMTSTDAFSFVLYEEDVELIRDLELQSVAIYIDDNLQVRGRIESTEIGQGPGLVLNCQGRDYLADLVECHVDPSLAVSSNMTLDQVIKLAARPVGIDSVSFDATPWRDARTGSAISTTLGQRSFQTAPLKDYKANPGEGIFQFLSRLCARFGCTLQPTMERNSVLLGAPDYVQEPAYSVTRTFANPDAANNNVLQATARRDYSKFPTVVLVSGNSGGSGKSRTAVSGTSYVKNTASGTIATAPATQALGSKLATSIPSNIQETIEALLPPKAFAFTQRIVPKSNVLPLDLYRLFYMRDNLSKDVKQVMNVAARAAAERLKDCLQYNVTFRGHQDPVTGRTFATDTIVAVSDEICNVHENLWVEHVRFAYEPGNGPTTTLTCWRPGSFGIGADK